MKSPGCRHSFFDEPPKRFGIDRINLSDVLVDADPLFATSRSRLHGTVTHRIAADIITGALPPTRFCPMRTTPVHLWGSPEVPIERRIRTLAAKGLVYALPKVGTAHFPTI